MRKKMCFVIMPFGAGSEYDRGRRESDFIYERIIKVAIHEGISNYLEKHEIPPEEQFEIEVIRELNQPQGGNITVDIIRNIARADLAIVDLTGRNANVFLELGVRFALRRNGTILITQNDNVPFNIASYRFVQYDPNLDGIELAKEELKKTIVSALERTSAPLATDTDSLVFEAIPGLSVHGKGLLEQSPDLNVVTWSEYWTHVNSVVEELNALRSVGAYIPHILLGISNGGLLLADTVLRLVFGNGIPLVCLWAFRSQDKYFDNPLNNALVQSKVITELAGFEDGLKPDDTIRILVMDDIVGTKRTFSQLLSYLKEKLPDIYKQIEIRFVFLYSPTEKDISELSTYFLSKDKKIAKKYSSPRIEQKTSRRELPYRKTIHYGDIATDTDSDEDENSD